MEMTKDIKIYSVLSNIRNRLANNFIMFHLYDRTEHFKLQDIKSTVVETKADIERLDFELDIRELTKEQLLSLDFGEWNEGDNLMLLPLWIKEFIKDVEVESIYGSTCMLSETDNITRHGCISYGIRV